MLTPLAMTLYGRNGGTHDAVVPRISLSPSKIRRYWLWMAEWICKIMLFLLSGRIEAIKSVGETIGHTGLYKEKECQTRVSEGPAAVIRR